ncbi:MAG TPA: hypothetical protein VFU76_13125 [Terriglobales bacterium]|nr:hypothetical protein [Terriglobales bacterium]
MAREMKNGPPTRHPHPSSFLSLLAGWVQQGVESFFATQRVLVDVAMRQNAIAMKSLREGLSDPEHSPVAMLTELAVEGTSSFVEAQRILLNLAQQENELLLNGIKERVSGSTPATAMTDLVRRSIDTFLGMQHEFLKLTSKQTVNWLESVKAGKGFDATRLVDLARDGMDHFVHTQQKFLDIVAQETTRATSGKPATMSKAKMTELSKLAREATNAFIDAQKKMLDVIAQQMTVNLKSATKAMDMLSPTRLLPMANFTGEGVKSFVSAEKALIENIVKPRNGHTTVMPRAKKRPARKATMAHAVGA